MSVQRNDEAEKIWEKMKQLERQPCNSEADFNWKKRELAALQQAYAKITGMPCNPHNQDESEAKSNAALFRNFRGHGPEHPTRDDLNNE